MLVEFRSGGISEELTCSGLALVCDSSCVVCAMLWSGDGLCVDDLEVIGKDCCLEEKVCGKFISSLEVKFELGRLPLPKTATVLHEIRA